MNLKAEELELNTLEFKNTTGLDLSPSEPGAIGSAKDVSYLMEYILQNYPELIESTTLGGARIYNSQGEYHDIENTNEVIYAIPNLLGSKTGYTDLAGGNLTVAFDAGMDRPIIVTVLGSTREERFSDVLRLVNAVRADISEI
jgi:D-alanyl-D-alanine carboxypeptidase (penicillin-binding protein 5/6)